MRYDDLTIDCPVCDRNIPAPSRRCPYCGTDLSIGGLDELEELVSHLTEMSKNDEPRYSEGLVEKPSKPIARAEGRDQEESVRQEMGDPIRPGEALQNTADPREKKVRLREQRKKERWDRKRQRREEGAPVR